MGDDQTAYRNIVLGIVSGTLGAAVTAVAQSMVGMICVLAFVLVITTRAVLQALASNRAVRTGATAQVDAANERARREGIVWRSRLSHLGDCARAVMRERGGVPEDWQSTVVSHQRQPTDAEIANADALNL